MDRERWIIDLTEAQRTELEALTHSPWRQEADRARALLWSIEGQASPEIAAKLNIRPERVRVWRCRYRRDGIAGLKRPAHPGRPGNRGEQALRVAREILAEPLRPWAPPWTLPRLQHEVERRSGIRLSQSWISRLLRKKGALPSADHATPSRANKTSRPSSSPVST